MIQAKDLTYSYRFEGSKYKTLDGLSLAVKPGELVVVLGHNGSGKTTFARHCNALVPMQGGSLRVAGLDAREQKNLWEIRRTCGMVFQNPDNQFVSSVVEEDIAFGLRNFGVPEQEISPKVAAALEAVGMSGFEKHSPHLLSGGQKQRIAIAGVLAVDPQILILDEVTAMLDPQGRREVLSTVDRLHKQGRTIIMISHYIEEAVLADRVVMIHDGKVVDEGPPSEILTDMDVLRRAGMLPPVTVQAYYDLKQAGVKLDLCPLTMEELVEELCRLH